MKDEKCDGCRFYDDGEDLIICSECVDLSNYVGRNMSVLTGLTEEQVQELCNTIYDTGFRPTNSGGSLLGFTDYTDFVEDQADIFKELFVKVLKLKTSMDENSINSIVRLISDTLKARWDIEPEEE